MYPLFGDMRVITAAYECIQKGYNVFQENPCDPWGRTINYPPIWYMPAALGIDQNSTVLLGITVVFLFFALTFKLIGNINYLEAIIYSSILFSPSIMLAVERGNNDLIVYSFLAVSLLMLNHKDILVRGFSYSLIVFAAVLKLFPIFAITALLKEKRRIVLAIAPFMMGVFITYIVFMLDDLKFVNSVTPRAALMSYGNMVLFDLLSLHFDRIGIDLPRGLGFLFFYASVFFILVFSWALAKHRHSLFQDKQELLAEPYMDGFRIGSCIYLGTFIIGNNWDYRFIFLIFVIPQLLVWIKSRSPLQLIATMALSGIVLTVWLSRYSYEVFGLDELINWLLFFYFACMLALTLPDWLKNWLART
ncbi:MAG: glycosyltransferase 87 family protein [Leptolyngbyaceae cyanobacterium HOT.MB2.61]|nr:glycosyltransferase 87 family protein [Leptolyngbyaceae cyanobacterium HOT.MB2.61]